MGDFDPSRAITRRIMGIETEYGIACIDDRTGSAPHAADEVARLAFRPLVDAYNSTNVFISNAGRLYLDVGSHPEFATPECDSLSQLVTYEQAGDRIVTELTQKAERRIAELDTPDAAGAGVYMFKNNSDSAGSSYGCHENYLVGRDVSVKKLGAILLPFLITRQLFCGAGRVATPQRGNPATEFGPGFCISQRADFMWEGVSSATTRSRPMINTRDEPHADSSRYRRLHVIVGDSNICQVSTALKVGTTLLLLEMIEAGVELPTFDMVNSVDSIRRVARSLDGAQLVHITEGVDVSALDIQRQYHEHACAWLEKREEDPGELTRIVELWGTILDAIGSGNLDAIARDVDWVAKYRLLLGLKERHGLEWDNPKLRHVDLMYHDIRPGRGIGPKLVARGLLNSWVDESAVQKATTVAPETTRAHLRGTFLTAARQAGIDTSVDWMRLKILRPEPALVELKDPFQNKNPDVEELLCRMR